MLTICFTSDFNQLDWLQTNNVIDCTCITLMFYRMSYNILIFIILLLALEASIQEHQKLFQMYQKDTSILDKDIKFAHQQYKHNQANCER